MRGPPSTASAQPWWSDLCSLNLSLDIDVQHFVRNVPSVGEESLSDYLFWKWRLLDARFKFLTVEPSESGEPDTGADFLLELWVLDSFRALPLLIQAKKFIEPVPHGPPWQGYRQKLLYPGGDSPAYQLNSLIQCADTMRMSPCYLIYSDGRCLGHPFALHLVRAKRIKSFLLPLPMPIKPGALLPKRKRRPALQLEQILAAGRPLHSLFCPASLKRHPARTQSSASATASLPLAAGVRPRSQLPNYVQQVLASHDAPVRLSHPIEANRRDRRDLHDGPWPKADLFPPRLKAVGVYDISAQRLPPDADEPTN